MARGMEVPECLYCSSYKRYDRNGLIRYKRDPLVRLDDMHICVKHGVVLPWQPGMYYVCKEFEYDGGEDHRPQKIRAPSYVKEGILYESPNAYQKSVEIAKFSELEKTTVTDD